MVGFIGIAEDVPMVEGGIPRSEPFHIVIDFPYQMSQVMSIQSTMFKLWAKKTIAC